MCARVHKHVCVNTLRIDAARIATLEYYKLEPCNYVGAPSLAWDAMLLMTGVELDLLKDSDVSLFFEPGIRGGQSVPFNIYAEANNK